MPTLNNRIDALERHALPKDQLTVCIISFDRPGPDGPIHDDPIAYVGAEGERWDRLDGETAQQHKDRARREVRRLPNGMAVLRECNSITEGSP